MVQSCLAIWISRQNLSYPVSQKMSVVSQSTPVSWENVRSDPKYTGFPEFLVISLVVIVWKATYRQRGLEVKKLWFYSSSPGSGSRGRPRVVWQRCPSRRPSWPSPWRPRSASRSRQTSSSSRSSTGTWSKLTHHFTPPSIHVCFYPLIFYPCLFVTMHEK